MNRYQQCQNLLWKITDSTKTQAVWEKLYSLLKYNYWSDCMSVKDLAKGIREKNYYILWNDLLILEWFGLLILQGTQDSFRIRMIYFPQEGQQ